ncbi:MAG: zinc-ribbon protein [Ferruginibacter sp.]|nr:zinc-ribbon protein [Ferruginibacter sp.]
MIIYGTKAKELAHQTLFEKCPTCGTQNSVEMHVFQKYAHIFWIPFFPIGKTAVSQCEHCKQVLKPKEMPASLKSEYENMKLQHKTPLWMFSGLAAIVVLIGLAMYNGKQTDERNAKWILAPQAGDIYEVKTPDKQYTLYKVDEVQGDSAYFRVNMYESNKLSGLADLKRKGDAGYSEDVYGVSKKDLKEMLEKKEIVGIERK